MGNPGSKGTTNIRDKDEKREKDRKEGGKSFRINVKEERTGASRDLPD